MRARTPHRWRTLLIRLLAVALPALLLAGCIFPPEPATTEADEVRTLFLVIFFLGAVVFVGVEGFLLYAVFRYRRRDDRLPVQHHGNTEGRDRVDGDPDHHRAHPVRDQHDHPGQHQRPERRPAGDRGRGPAVLVDVPLRQRLHRRRQPARSSGHGRPRR